MEPNITFFIQLFHFYLAYLILEKFLFRPTIKDITYEQNQYNDLITTIHTQQKLLKDKEDRKQEEWNAFKRSFARTIPQLLSKEHAIRTHTIISVVTMDQKSQQEYEQMLEQTLVKRLSHVS